MSAHSPSGVVIGTGQTYCIKCGLIYLRNDATRKAIKKPCPGTE